VPGHLLFLLLLLLLLLADAGPPALLPLAGRMPLLVSLCPATLPALCRAAIAGIARSGTACRSCAPKLCGLLTTRALAVAAGSTLARCRARVPCLRLPPPDSKHPAKPDL
jgi:hypothetical protein